MASSLTLVARKIFGSKNERELKRMRPIVEEINQLEPTIALRTDEASREKIAGPKARTSGAEDRAEEAYGLDEALPEVFAIVREASKRTLGQRHFDVQVV